MTIILYRMDLYIQNCHIQIDKSRPIISEKHFFNKNVLFDTVHEVLKQEVYFSSKLLKDELLV